MADPDGGVRGTPGRSRLRRGGLVWHGLRRRSGAGRLNRGACLIGKGCTIRAARRGSGATGQWSGPIVRLAAATRVGGPPGDTPRPYGGRPGARHPRVGNPGTAAGGFGAPAPGLHSSVYPRWGLAASRRHAGRRPRIGAPTATAGSLIVLCTRGTLGAEVPRQVPRGSSARARDAPSHRRGPQWEWACAASSPAAGRGAPGRTGAAGRVPARCRRAGHGSVRPRRESQRTDPPWRCGR